MWRRRCQSWVLLAGFGALAACSGEQPAAAGKAATVSTMSTAAAGHAATSSTNATGDASSSQPTAASSDATGSDATAGRDASSPVLMSPGSSDPLACTDSGAPFKQPGCPCKVGETSACWTGPVADRNMGTCHDGLQVCEGSAEFASWGECMGEELECGEPPPPDEPDDDCTCIPGAVIQCSEDCSVGIICSLTATKTCLPDGRWSTCREDVGVPLDAPGFQCRNMLHGCVDVLEPDGSGSGQGELFVGDCSKQFKCGHAPPPPPPPTLPE